MKICFYTPFKPLDHRNPSGDMVIAKGLQQFLSKSCNIKIAARLRTRWIFFKPWLWPRIVSDRSRAEKLVENFKPDIWLTYHSYYKAPDVVGPAVAKKTGLPYVIFQGIYSTKRRRDVRTGLGFLLNRIALLNACHIFANRKEDEKNLARLIPRSRLTYVPPGIFPGMFRFDLEARKELRSKWRVNKAPVILTAAMFRPGVKTEGLDWVIRTCGELYRKGKKFYLVIAGDGSKRAYLETLAETHIPGHALFLGKISRRRMHRFYSAGDIFVFPGIRESLGMVFLEAQSCRLPVVAFSNGGIPEVVKDGKTGFLTPLMDKQEWNRAVCRLLSNYTLRQEMGRAAEIYVRKNHDSDKNYTRVSEILKMIGKSSANRRFKA